MLFINNLKQTNLHCETEINAAVERVVKSGWYILGPEVDAFEQEFAEFCGVKQCVSLASGTDALELSLRVLDVGIDDEIITVANAGMYSAIVIKMVGAKPVFADIDPQTMTMSPESLKNIITPKTKAIIITHLYGQMADIGRILDIANQHNIPLIEDCAQAHGAVVNNQKAGSFGIMGGFSFYPTKNLGALGDGGAIVTNEPKIAEKIRQLRQYGWHKKYNVTLANGKNSRLDEIQAAVLRVKLKYLDKQNQYRRNIAAQYNKHLSGLPLILPSKLDNSYVAHLYVIRNNAREQISNCLLQQNIKTDIHYPIPDHKQAILCQDYADVVLPETEKTCGQVLTLPCFGGMTDAEVQQVIVAVKTAMEKN